MTLYADAALAATLERLGEELRFVLIVSAARLRPLAEAPAVPSSGAGAASDPAAHAERVAVERSNVAGGALVALAKPAAGTKCARCWHRLPDVGTHEKHPALCARCIDNVDGAGETRRIA